MPFSVAILDEIDYKELTSQRVTQLCSASFSVRSFEVERLGEISVALVSLDTIRELNMKFRGMGYPTDVLSFEIDGPYGEMVGEIVIAPEYTGLDLAGVEELVVHGALHLAGMDHGDEFEGTEMAVVQEAVMRSVDARKG